MNSILLSAVSFSSNGKAVIDNSSEALFSKKTLSNGMEIFDFDEELIFQKMERMMELLDEAL